MTKKAIVKQIDLFLGAAGFVRKGMTWNREVDAVVQVVDIQVSKAGDSMTVNSGVFLGDIYKEVWGSELQGVIEEPFCIVRSRIGELMGGHDMWWSVDDDKAQEEILTALEQSVLPFLDKFRVLREVELFLDGKRGHKDPLAKLYLAAIKRVTGDMKAACAIVGEVQKTALGNWCNRAAELAGRFGCKPV